jgi:hypothetical protein
VLLKKTQHFTIQKSLLEDQDPAEEGDEDFSVDDS